MADFISESIKRQANITELYDQSEHKKWIKLISMKSVVPFDDYQQKNSFKHVANVVLDNDMHTTGKKAGTKKRNTLIKFVPVVTTGEFKEKKELLYIMTVNGYIVKIGGSRNGLSERIASYMCGHHTPERGKSGDCSKTNAYIYNTFEFYLKNKCDIKMYCYTLPVTLVKLNIMNKDIEEVAQTYHVYESIYIAAFKQQYKMIPVLCTNSDPTYH